ncbi:MAG: hypothetical protein WC385_01230 [Candidatus Paceibacterota bacterium]|jgi:hypothetical protein
MKKMYIAIIIALLVATPAFAGRHHDSHGGGVSVGIGLAGGAFGLSVNTGHVSVGINHGSSYPIGYSAPVVVVPVRSSGGYCDTSYRQQQRNQVRNWYRAEKESLDYRYQRKKNQIKAEGQSRKTQAKIQYQGPERQDALNVIEFEIQNQLNQLNLNKQIELDRLNLSYQNQMSMIR